MPEKKGFSLKKKFNRSEIQVFLLVLLLLFSYTASLNMLIPLYSVIPGDLKFSDSIIYLPDSLSVLISAFVMVIWGYYVDRLDKNLVIKGGTILSIFGFLFTVFCRNFTQLLIARIITGMGLGFALPVAYSVLNDVISSEERSGLFGFLTIYSAISNGIGQGLSAFLSPLNILNLGWHFPFLILSFIAIITIILLTFIKLPEMGKTEESLAELHKFEEIEYGYMINQRALVKMLKKKSNRYLIINGFFSIIPGTIIIFSLIITFSHPTQGMFATLPDIIRIQVSSIMAAITSIGYMLGSIVLSKIGDVLYNKNKRNRTILALLSNIIAIPLCLLMIFQLQPIKISELGIIYPSTILNRDIMSYVIGTLIAIFQNYPNYIAFMFFSFLGTFFSAGMVTNKNAVMVDINLPEHRGTATSLFKLTEQIGKSITLMLVAGLLSILGTYKNLFYAGLFFWIPSAILWYLCSRSVVTDIENKEILLKERAQLSFFDYFFELEISIDDGIQLIQDAKDMMVLYPKKAEVKIDRALNKFIKIAAKASKKSLDNLSKKAENLLIKSIYFQENLALILTNPNYQKLQELFMEIDAEWQKSDFGKIEVLYQSAYLKVCEARLRRHYNPIESSRILNSSIEIYNHVVNMCTQRVIEEGIKKLSASEKKIQERISNLLVMAQKSRSNTGLLKKNFDKFIKTIISKDIKKKNLDRLIVLSAEYGIKLQEIIEETFDKRLVRKTKRTFLQIDELFKDYDQWEKNE